MTEEQATAVAAQALPCPFCGESLVVKSDHHGFWVAHREEPGPCFDSVAQLLDESDLARWNTRGGVDVLARQRDTSRRLNELLAEMPQGRKCPRCGMSMVHERLRGYQCPRGCQT